MKVGIITIHFGINYGSVLQTYALSYFLKNELLTSADDIEIINYIPERYSKKNRYFHTIQKMSFLRRGAYSIICAPATYFYNHIFLAFLKKNTPLGKEIHDYNSLSEKYKDYDLLITGSDQVWNSHDNRGYDAAYYLEFADEHVKKYSYAASSGKLEFDLSEKEKMLQALSRFTDISVRESQMIQLLKEIGINDVKQVLDPVFLLPKEKWIKFGGQKKIVDEKYIFIYLLNRDTVEPVDFAVKIADKLGIKTVMISYGHIWSKDKRVDYYLNYQTPVDFINLIANSEYVVTNSFHGIAFSLNLNKQFTAFKRQHFNSRLESISKLFDLENHIIESKLAYKYDEEWVINNYIDYSTVNNKLSAWREKSVGFLEKMVKEYGKSK